MKVSHTLTSGVLIAVFSAVSTPLFVSAAESPIVVESRDSSIVSYRPPIETTEETGGIEQQYQMQLLQQEVMDLRGQVEQMQHELNQLKRVQDDRYLELDARLQQTFQAAVVPSNETEPEAEEQVVESQEILSEKDLYGTTQILIRNRQYDLAITQLESLIDRFPDGDYTPNAYYWLGQVYAAKANPNYEKARQALAQVISYFPGHSKVPDAAYALGKVHHALGDCGRASELLQQVVDQYEGKSAAKLAENYLRESVNCDP